jgi:hypothetical protein
MAGTIVGRISDLCQGLNCGKRVRDLSDMVTNDKKKKNTAAGSVFANDYGRINIITVNAPILSSLSKKAQDLLRTGSITA